MIAASTYKQSEAVDRNLSPLYWTDAAPDNSLFIDLERRASKFSGTIDFNGFLAAGSRNARVCITVYGKRDASWEHAAEFPTEILGYNYIDLEDTVVEETGSQDFSVDFAAVPGQAFMVHVRYVEGREGTSFFGQCGDTDILASCTGQCYELDETVGVPFEGGIPFDIDPAIAADPACTVNMEDVCP
jgi:hypothetical protein